MRKVRVVRVGTDLPPPAATGTMERSPFCPHAMSLESGFIDLLARVRRGDAAAAEELVRAYEPQIKRVIRIRLGDTLLRRQLDSMDVSQSVMGEFFLRVSGGQFDLQSPAELVALLSKMAKNKLIDRSKYHRAARRDIRRDTPIDGDAPLPSGSGTTPSMIVSREELAQICRRLLSADELRITEARAADRSWEELATEFNTTPESLRKRHARALDRVAKALDEQLR